MAIGVRIDFASAYEIENVSKDLRSLIFETPLVDGRIVPLKIEI